MTFEEIIAFHGHSCPGLTIGYRMAGAALKALNALRAKDEEIFAIVENDACGVDALQCLTGCTFGKGNLSFLDYGKQVYTLYHRSTGRGVRVHLHGRDIPDEVRQDRDEFTRWLREAPEDSFLEMREVTIEEPPRAVIRSSQPCDSCGESVMESRIQSVEGRWLCIPCSQG